MKYAVMIDEGYGRGRVVSRHHEIDKAISKCHLLTKYGIQKVVILPIEKKVYKIIVPVSNIPGLPGV